MFFRKQKPAGNDNLPVPASPTYIGADTRIEGSVITEGGVRVAGTVHGLVSAQVCIVEPGGSVEGEIDGDEIIVGGRVTGPLQARHVHLQDGASVAGDITSETIAVDSGARLSGAVWQRNAEAPKAQSLTHEPVFASSSLWDNPRDGDEYRPLRAIRPAR